MPKPIEQTVQGQGVSAIIYGESGIGKTHFCGTLPGKTLIIAAEPNGIRTLQSSPNARNIEVELLPERGKSMAETADRMNSFFDNLYITLYEKYDNVILDSATELAARIMLDITDPAKQNGVPSTHNYLEVQTAMGRYLRIMRDIAAVKGRNVIITALEAEIVSAQSEQGQSSKTHPALSGKKFPSQAEGLYDVVAHLEKKPDGTRYFRLTGNDSFVAKDRFGRQFCLADGATLISGKIGNENTKKENEVK